MSESNPPKEASTLEQTQGQFAAPAAKNEVASNLLASVELSASASSLASVASSTASVATTKSGIRPPSKIGRPCGDRHKPPVPPSPPSSKYCFGDFVKFKMQSTQFWYVP